MRLDRISLTLLALIAGTFVHVDARTASIISIGASALAQVGPPPPPPTCPPICPGGGGGGGGGGSDGSSNGSGGNRGHMGTDAWVNVAATAAGHVILYAGNAKPVHHVLWSIGSAIGSLAGAGPVGGGAALALFEPDQGLIAKLFRPGGLKCQDIDRGRVAGCAEWLDAQRPKLRPKKRPKRPKVARTH